jgi:hypothetical protein
MENTIQFIDRESLVIATCNHRQAGSRKITGLEWLDGLKPLIVADLCLDGKYIILDGFRRYTYLTACNTFPCIVVDADVTSEQSIQKAIEMYKGDTLALSLVEVLKFGCDKVRYGIGRYLAKDGETLFLQDMLNVYEDYHPCAVGNGDMTDKENKKTLKNFHKGLNQSCYRACMLGGQFVEDYANKVKGVTTALREGFDAARKAQMRGLSWSDARLEALTVYNASLEKAQEKKAQEAASVDGIGNYISTFMVSVKESDASEEMKTHYGILLSAIVANDVEAFMKEVLG